MTIDYKTSGVDLAVSNDIAYFASDLLDIDYKNQFCSLSTHPYLDEYLFAACCDGVGTKIIPLLQNKKIKTIANDLVAMNLNDLVTSGAFPVFFLDYLASSTLDKSVIKEFLTHLKEILNEYNCKLIGGETSELKDLITSDNFDACGFCVGLVKKENLLGKHRVKEGDVIIGLPSNGPHSNGFTLIRKLHSKKLLNENDLQDAIAPTTIYAKEIIELSKKNLVNAAANVTGGGIKDNLSRIIPDNLCAAIKKQSIPTQKLFKKIVDIIGEDEAYQVFNMGVGFFVITSPENTPQVLDILAPYKPFICAEVVKNEDNCNFRFG